MANEIRTAQATGLNLYAVVQNPNGQLWNGSGFEPIAPGNWANYTVAMAEQGGTGLYLGSMPAGIVAAGSYLAAVYLRVGSSPAVGDLPVDNLPLNWGGVALAASVASIFV